MARRSRMAMLDALPKFRQMSEDVSIRGSDWDLERTALKQVLECRLFLEEFQNGVAGGSWKLRLTKRRGTGRIGRGWEATVSHVNDSEEVIVGRGSDKSWVEAIGTLKYMGVVRGLKELGRRYYNKERWIPIRPFSVRYSWKDPEEPNARYSPFTFQGDVFDTATDGVVAWTYQGTVGGGPPTYAIRNFVEEMKANAFVTTPDAEGWCQLWHRDGMMTADRIHIDDWRARLIAGQ